MLNPSLRHSARGIIGIVTSKMATACGRGSTPGLESLKFDNLALRTLPIDPQTEVYPRQVPGACFSRVDPTPLDNPQLVALSSSALKLIDVDETETDDQQFVQYFGGNKIIPGSEPSAHCYCGHQFGSFAGQLGDGATMYLGEVINAKGERWELQFKGAGLTPYSRSADGRKVLRSSIREFLCSEAMHHLGVPTTRAGTCVTSDSRVVRDIFYDGNPIHERCTVITRIAPTFLRFGSFEIFKGPDEQTGRKGPSHGRDDILDVMLDYAISTFYPEIDQTFEDRKAKILAFYTEVVTRTAKLVAHWQSVGFCHGVLNTDNMSILGLTIDYGPFGFMERFDPDFICNASDDGGRYTYAKQPEICKWNLGKFAEAIGAAVPIAETKEILERVYDATFRQHYRTLMANKLGLTDMMEGEEVSNLDDLIASLFDTMKQTGADFTNTFGVLSEIPYSSVTENYDVERRKALERLLAQCCSVEDLKRSLRSTMDPRQLQMLLMMAQSQPMFLAMMGMEGKLRSELEKREKLQEIQHLTAETKAKRDKELWEVWIQSYEKALQKSFEKEAGRNTSQLAQNERVKIMTAANPRFILRNWVAQNAISRAEEGDFNEVKNVLNLLENPFASADLQKTSPSSAEDDHGRIPDQRNDDKLSSMTMYQSCAGIDYATQPPESVGELRVT